MAISGSFCGSSDIETDWIANSSIGYISGESKLTREILLELTSKNQIDMKPAVLHKGSQELGKSGTVKAEMDGMIIKKINGLYSFENFDETQHLAGCPLKWFYNKKLSEKNGIYRIERRRSSAYTKSETAVECRNRKDRTPMDVKIREFQQEINRRSDSTNTREKDGIFQYFSDKINLLNKSRAGNGPKNDSISTISEITGTKFTDDTVEETRRRNLAAKLNWKLREVDHDEDTNDEDECLSKTFSELSCRRNYLPPRPLVGMKPLLTILLYPNRESKCCATKIHFQSDSERGDNIASPTLSIQSLDLPVLTSNEQMPKSKMITRPWRSRVKTASSKESKKHLIPNQVMINLRECKAEISAKRFHSTSAKRSNNNDKTKERNSLPTLIYQLRDKKNYRRKKDGVSIEDLINDIIGTDDEFKFSRFFHSDTSTRENRTATASPSTSATENPIENSLTRTLDFPQIHLTCEKVRIFEKLSKKRK